MEVDAFFSCQIIIGTFSRHVARPADIMLLTWPCTYFLCTICTFSHHSNLSSWSVELFSVPLLHFLNLINAHLDLSPGALDLYPDKIHNKLIFSEKVPRGTYINILKVPENPPGAFREIQDGVQDDRRRIVISGKLCEAVIFSSIVFCNIPFQLVYGQ